VKYIWGSKIRISTIVYILCHYALLANVLYLLAISQIWGIHPSHCWIVLNNYTHSCNTWYKIIGALSVLGRAAIICPVILLPQFHSTLSFTARAYAVWGRKRMVFVYLASVGIICVGLDIAHVPGLQCEGPSSIPM
ncbi:uncharacterized protein C8R40DRAFT_1037460, partial [Lentinula edodes]|uniref:uncharacterized protein n=1 Tax=Lentinula edodes TaxID=5353 RepID=UPI001E8E943E